jgi:hypothetical protein
MSPKLLKPTKTSKKPTAVDCSGDNSVPKATETADTKEEIRQDDVGGVGCRPHLPEVCDSRTLGVAHQEQGYHATACPAEAITPCLHPSGGASRQAWCL